MTDHPIILLVCIAAYYLIGYATARLLINPKECKNPSDYHVTIAPIMVIWPLVLVVFVLCVPVLVVCFLFWLVGDFFKKRG